MAAPEPGRRPSCSGGLKRRRERDDDDVDSADETSESAGHVAPAPSIYDVLHVLQGAHRQGSGFLGYFSTFDVAPARAVCKDLRDAVAGFPWGSADFVPGSLRLSPVAGVFSLRHSCQCQLEG